MSRLLEVAGLHKVYERSALLSARRHAVHAVRDVSFQLERGTIFGLVGESGSGKSTLARAMLHIDPPTEGTVTFSGRAVASIPRRELRQKMQIVSQDPNSALNPRLRIETSVGEGLANAGVRGDERKRRVMEMLELVGIPASRMHHYPHEFSGGMKQRICIARALAVAPELLVLDEPVSSLDVSIQAQIINLLTDLKSKLNLTYVFISHDINLVGYISDVIGVMRQGELVELGPTETLMTGANHEYTQKLLGSVPRYVDRRTFHHTLQSRSAV